LNQNPVLQRRDKVRECNIAAQDEIENVRWRLQPQILMPEFDRFTMARPYTK
jgi:hypothetical protein